MPPFFEVTRPWVAFAAGPGGEALAREALPAYLARQRWFPAKSRTITRVRLEEAIPMPPGDAVLFVAGVEYTDGGHHRFAVPVAFAAPDVATRLRHEAPERVIAETVGGGVLHDDMTEGLGASLVLAMADSSRWPASRGALVGERTSAFGDLVGGGDVGRLVSHRVTAEQSNTSVILGDKVIVKLIRRLEPGLNPEYEIGRHLTDRAPFPGIPALGGAVVWRDTGTEPTVLAVAQAFVRGASVLRERIVPAVAAFMREEAERAGNAGWQAPPDACRELFAGARALGRRTGELHLALADARGDPAFEPEPTGSADLAVIARDMQSNVSEALDLLSARAGELPPAASALAVQILRARPPLLESIAGVARVAPGLRRIRVHGDYQLDQVLVADGRFVFIDFEGEPLRPLAARREKFLALKDVAGMARSYSYAAYAALFAVAGDEEEIAGRLEPVARWWQAEAAASFIAGYRGAAGGAAFLPSTRSDFDTLLSAFLVEKATYELRYEIDHRPRWLRIPLRGVVDLLDRLEPR